MSWNYTPEEFKRPTPGNYRCVIVGAEEKTTKETHKKMIVISTRLNGTNVTVKNHIVEGEYFNRNMTNFFDAFGIERGDFNYFGWIGAIGAVKVGEDDKGYLTVKWYLTPEQAKDLPAWEGEVPERQTVSKITDDKDGEGEDDLPF
jgi:hypothetical protein